MNQKNCALALEEITEPGYDQASDPCFEPELNVLVKSRRVIMSEYRSSAPTVNDQSVVRVSGKITISF